MRRVADAVMLNDRESVRCYLFDLKLNESAEMMT
jgi:hypothetical protein